uniref:Acyl-CoA dehydrogenase n=1 Tax=Amycolatopsis sp. CP2808 TaxID=411144 RepID=A0A649UQ99_9PSEU|nr:Acyl-CoA dehydrogenase [Amycolatopsis sp. CP2808]
MPGDTLARATALITELVEGQAEEWDRTGLLPPELFGKLGPVLCAQVAAEHGGLGLSSRDNGELTAHTGSLCGSVRSVMTTQGMAAWTIRRSGDAAQRARLLPRLTGGELAAVAFSEPRAGSDLSAMTTRIRDEGDTVVLDGRKVWVTGGHYAGLIVVFGRYGEGGAAVVVPADAPGVRIRRIPDPLGCRAAGHADVDLDGVRLPADSLLGGAGQSLSLLVTSALTYGRLSVAWGCAGLLRGCLAAATDHARSRSQFGKPLAEHQLVSGHLGRLLIAEQVSARVCEHASEHWDSGSPDVVMTTVLAKHVSAGNAADGASAAVQVLASAGAHDSSLVARAYRDAKLMEVIEGTNELCLLMLAGHALSGVRR